MEEPTPEPLPDHVRFLQEDLINPGMRCRICRQPRLIGRAHRGCCDECAVIVTLLAHDDEHILLAHDPSLQTQHVKLSALRVACTRCEWQGAWGEIETHACRPLSEYRSSYTPDFRDDDEHRKILTAVPDDLLCMICLAPCLDPKEMSCCEKLICRRCMNDMGGFKNSPCPNCRASPASAKDPSRTIRNLLDVDVQCLACGLSMKRGECGVTYQKHCDTACPISCPFGCGNQIMRDEKRAHGEECVDYIVECNAADVGCAFKCKRRDLLDHQRQCTFIRDAPLLRNIEHAKTLSFLLILRIVSDSEEKHASLEHPRRPERPASAFSLFS